MSCTLKCIIRVLESYPDRSKVVPVGFGKPGSYRGYYVDLAFSPEKNITIDECLQNAQYALGKTFTGYKGGEYLMDESSICWISRYGMADGDAIGPVMLSYMLDWPLEKVMEVMEYV